MFKSKGDRPTIKTVEESVIEMEGPMSSSYTSNKNKKNKGKNKNVDEYFVGPRDVHHHSKYPFFFQLHGSIMPSMILPMLMVAVWVTTITLLCKFHFKKHKFDPLLLTVLGFLVGLSLSFRSTTAYERYNEGRKYWAQLTLTSQNLGRIIWVHAREREGDEGKKDLLAKITCLNLLAAYSVAVKHRLRFEPYIDYDDMKGQVEFLDTFAKEANKGVDVTPPPKSKRKQLGEFLGVSFARSNPRKPLKRAMKPLGNLPLEILGHLQAYIDSIIDNATLKVPIYQVQSITSLAALNDVLTGTDRILNTPLPIAYRIAISQITWLYILLLPFMLYAKLGWNTIPGTLLAAYIILGLAMIGKEIENPFGLDVNDLPLDSFCEQIAADLDIIMSSPAPKPVDFVQRAQNMPLYPLSESGYQTWAERSEEEIRDALRIKPNMLFDRKKRILMTDGYSEYGVTDV